MDIEREIRDVSEGVEVALPPMVVPIDEFWRDPRDLDLLAAATAALEAEHPETAVVLAQTAAEVMTDWALRMALRLSAPEGAVDPLLNVIPDRTFMDRRTRAVWTSLTGDVITDNDRWREFHGHVERRNRVVHTGFRRTVEDARASISVCEWMVFHVESVIHQLARI